jgi:hypothetical protein
MEAEFNALNLGQITYTQFGNARESDIDDLLDFKNIHGEERLAIVDVWKRHPNNRLRG